MLHVLDILFLVHTAAIIYPVVKKQHQLLVTLLLCNAAAMEALPLFLDKMVHPVMAVVLSVTFVLLFGEVIPQAVCSHHGLAIGASMIWLVKLLMMVCYVVAYPLGKVLDWMLGDGTSALFRRAQLKALVSIHSREAGKGGELTHDETTIISGALDLTGKIAKEAMTPIESMFSLDVNSRLDRDVMNQILRRGHSRIPVYSGSPKNIIGLLLIKNLLLINLDEGVPVSAVAIRRMPRVYEDVPLYDMLNEFQKGGSHMAVVVSKKPMRSIVDANIGERMREAKEVSLTPKGEKKEGSQTWNKLMELKRPASETKERKWVVDSWEDNEEVVGIITLEDVIEELLQEEIVDETDEYVDVHRKIRVSMMAAIDKSPELVEDDGQEKLNRQESSSSATSSLAVSTSAQL
ncbi:hypothetical protein CBR_g66765 [Chara braunii]|uniref:CNNM transmembrane domain-containing protein n=1 Tax=Chara braunii TaxID=69332 RepID=A0A388K9C4_CHABU|nr:hypothetical protein CBR_g66765 [Chara braunii]|eukprot:GBG66629.1 hypothetical protein CBR_g66765 [Chara braunii]